MSWIVAGLTIGGAAVKFFSSKKQQKEAEAEQATKQAEMDRMKDVYSNLDTSNPFAGMENQFAGMENQFAGMTNQFAGLENTMEDLTVNQQQAQFEADQFQQSQANIMEGMRGAAGGSGIAATVQALAGQGQLQAHQSSATIGAQESSNQALAAQQAGKLQEMEARGAEGIDRLKREGAAAVDLQRRTGEGMVQEAETGRASTLLAMEYGALAGAQAGVQAAYGNQASAYAMELERIGQNKALTGQIIGGVVGAAGSVYGGYLAGK